MSPKGALLWPGDQVLTQRQRVLRYWAAFALVLIGFALGLSMGHTAGLCDAQEIMRMGR
jgi:hypothetical protein